MNDQHFKFWIDLTSISTVVASLIGWLPPIAALASIIWTGIQIYDWWTKRKQNDDIGK